jgi:sugar phosphate isomerase/epimerase
MWNSGRSRVSASNELTPMEVGLFSRTFARSTLEQVLDAVLAHGLSHIHFNLKSAGIASLTDELNNAQCRKIRKAFETRGYVMTSISATFNAIHPDLRQREADTLQACRLIEHCREMGTSIVTLCTGTRDPYNMWRRHPGNQIHEFSREEPVRDKR